MTKLEMTPELSKLLKDKVDDVLVFFPPGDQKELESANIPSQLQAQLLDGAQYAITAAVKEVVEKRSEELQRLFLQTVYSKQKVTAFLATQSSDNANKDFLAQFSNLSNVEAIPLTVLDHLKNEAKRLKLAGAVAIIEERIQLERDWSKDLFDSVWHGAGNTKILEQFEKRVPIELRDLMALGQIQKLEYELNQSWKGIVEKRKNFLKFSSAATTFLNLAESRYLKLIKTAEIYQYYTATHVQHVNDFIQTLTEQMQLLKRDLVKTALDQLEPQSTSTAIGESVDHKEKVKRSANAILSEARDGSYASAFDEPLKKRLNEYMHSIARRRSI